jgi:hypothetical protein
MAKFKQNCCIKKFIPEAVLSKISVPATIVDKHGKILAVHLPDILTASHTVCFWLGSVP